MESAGGWDAVRRSVRERLGRAAYEAWFENLEGRSEGDRLVLLCPDRFSREWIQRRYGDVLKSAAEAYRSVEYEIEGAEPIGVGSSQIAPYSAKPRDLVDPVEVCFETFVGGPGNALALEAARAVARGAAGRCNPLVLTGTTGAGKTHLCRAIQRATSQAVVYRSSEEFTSEVTTAMRSGGMEHVRHRYRKASNVLILEDVQFLEGKKATQSELFHTVDHLIGQGKTVVFTADRHPRELNLDRKLLSRMTSGLVARIGPADEAMQAQILRAKAAAGGVRVPDDCLRALARRPVANTRELLGGLNQVIARATLLRRSITLQLVQEAFADADVGGPQRSIDEIMALTARAYELSVDDLRSRSRRQHIVKPRHFAMYLCRRYTDASLKEIGRAFSRDHTSVMHALQAVERRTAEKPQLRYEFEALAARFGEPQAKS
jgi:chromosomal replication initiator protein